MSASSSLARLRDAPAPRPLDCADAVLAIMPAVMDAMRSAMRVHVGEQLSVPQFRCLNFIAKQPGCSVTAVAAFLGVTLPTASAMVDRLVKAGAVAPTTAATDRRRSELQLTASGRALLLQIRGDARGEFARALARCSVDELRQLLAGMAVLESAFVPAGAA
jgi:DNA-binding MarR family transcriptional regulator